MRSRCRSHWPLAVLIVIGACSNDNLRKENERLRLELAEAKSRDCMAKAPADTPAGDILGEIVLKFPSKPKYDSPCNCAEAVVAIENRSSAFVETMTVKVQGYGAGDEYLGECPVFVFNLGPGKSKTDTCTLTDVRLKMVKRLHAIVGVLTPQGRTRKEQVKTGEADWRQDDTTAGATDAATDERQVAIDACMAASRQTSVYKLCQSVRGLSASDLKMAVGETEAKVATCACGAIFGDSKRFCAEVVDPVLEACKAEAAGAGEAAVACVRQRAEKRTRDLANKKGHACGIP